MTRNELKEICKEALTETIEASPYTSVKIAEMTKITTSCIKKYKAGLILPSAETWHKLSNILPLPDLMDELKTNEHNKRNDRFNVSTGGIRDISPEERNEIIFKAFGCLPKDLPLYDDYSYYVLVKLSTISDYKLEKNRKELIVNLFIEASKTITEPARRLK